MKAGGSVFETTKKAVDLSKHASGYEEYVMLCRAELVEPLTFRAYSEVLTIRELIGKKLRELIIP